ncbi:TonB-dependent receptor [Sphingobacterium bambusae]|uniref:TonB-dependent receptor n=1 Tax=Sphingobacterium bambusae TaxID=662858 RepID=A0ABW6BCJ1_9SPHI|nr:TonB-dependent receptor plug domain-containing protein [Sphingobacterium bambusae]WPL49512.1 TonB-dependent receptor plug domain-containing protein [Sphingobacterium bambusae]
MISFPLFRILAAVASLLILFSGVRAQSVQPDSVALSADTASIETVSVLGLSAAQLAGRRAYNITAVDAKKLHNTTLDIAHVLDRVPGARLRETGGVGSDFDFSINGFSGKRVKFFMDGVPIDNFGTSFQINNIPINIAERIEVYKGVVPIWLGSDALGGAVNIITGNKKRNFVDVGYSYGSFNTHRSNVNAAITSSSGLTLQLNAFQNYSDNDYKVTLDAADIRTGKYYPDTTVRRFHDRFHNETIITQVGVLDKEWADELLLGITLGKNYKEIQTGARMDAVFGAWHTRGSIVMPTLRYRKNDLWLDGLDVSLNANYNMGTEQNIDTVFARYGWLGDSIKYAGAGGERAHQLLRYRNNLANVAGSVSYTPNTKHAFALNNVWNSFDRKGGNMLFPEERRYKLPQQTYKNILGASYQYAANDRWNNSVFAKYLYQKASTILIQTDVATPTDTVYRDVEVNRHRFGYGLASSYFLRQDLQLKLSYEKTNRMPEYDDFFGDLINGEANWDVRPESSDNVNLGIALNHNFKGRHQLYVNLTGVYFHAKDYIFYTVNQNNRLVAKNLSAVSNLGIESEFRYAYKDRLTLGANLTYQNIRDRQRYLPDLPQGIVLESQSYNDRIPNIPYLFGNADASIFFNNVYGQGNRLIVSYNVLYVHDFFLYPAGSANPASMRSTPMQLAQDASIAYTLAQGKYNIALECRNLTDRRLYDNFSLQKPGRGFYLKMRYFIDYNKH